MQASAQVLVSVEWQIRRGRIARQLSEQGQLPIKISTILSHQFFMIAIVLRIEISILQWTAGGARPNLNILPVREKGFYLSYTLYHYAFYQHNRYPNHQGD